VKEETIMRIEVYLLLAAALFLTLGVMMVVLLRSMFKSLPHARHIAALYMISYGAMAFSAVLQFLSGSPGHGLLLSIVLLVVSGFGFGLALVTPFATAVWLIQDKADDRYGEHHRDTA